MANSDSIFSFLNDVYDLLPERDRSRFGELWKAYEQTYGDVWLKSIERDLAVNIDSLPLYNIQRWLKHSFDTTTRVERAAFYRTNQDLSKTVNLSARYLLKIGIDGGTPFELDMRGANPSKTTNVEIRDKINAAAGFQFATLVVLDALLDLESRTIGITSRITFYPASNPALDAMELIIGIDQVALPYSVPEFRFEYQLLDKNIVSIPVLQNKIHDELASVWLYKSTDYNVEFGTGIISFKDIPPEALWAKDNYVNLETPYNNFGYLLDIYDSNTAAYLKAVKGLWYAFWTGPRPENIRRSLYLLFGLPTASADGTVLNVTATEITLKYSADETEEVFIIPSDLFPTVAIGDAVSRFQPLVTGITVQDKINSPGFIEREVGRFGIQPFLTENASRGEDPNTDESKALKLLEANTYLPQIEVSAFISPDIKLNNIKTFLNNIQPMSRTFMFQVLIGLFRESFEIKESIGQDIAFTVTPHLDYNPSMEMSQADREDAEINPLTGDTIDSENIVYAEYLDVEVRQFGVLVDSFAVEG
jgi:hypothetical protein